MPPISPVQTWRSAIVLALLITFLGRSAFLRAERPTELGSADPAGSASAPVDEPSLEESQFESDAPQSVVVRMGNDALRALGPAIPRHLSSGIFAGRVSDVRTRSRMEGQTFRVHFGGIRYTSTLDNVSIEGVGDEQLSLRLGLRDLELTIARTSIDGGSRRAIASRTRVVIGHRKPAFLSAVLTPTVVDGEIRLRLRSTDFEIESGNWYVRPPARVTTSGPLRTIFMPRDRVSRNLVRGLQRGRAMIARQVESVMPSVLVGLEADLNAAATGDLLSTIQPLSQTRQRMKLTPEFVSTDDRGVTLMLGMASSTADSSKEVANAVSPPPVPPAADELERSRDLVVLLTPKSTEPVSRTDGGDAAATGTPNSAAGDTKGTPTNPKQPTTDWFRRCWSAFTGQNADFSKTIPDLVFEPVRLRFADAGWTGPTIWFRFESPGVEVSNASADVVSFRVRTETSRWGNDLTLSPGASHRFRESPLIIQLGSATEEIPPGGQAILGGDDDVEIRSPNDLHPPTEPPLMGRLVR